MTKVTKQDILKDLKGHNIRFLRLMFTDILGIVKKC